MQKVATDGFFPATFGPPKRFSIGIFFYRDVSGAEIHFGMRRFFADTFGPWEVLLRDALSKIQMVVLYCGLILLILL